MNQAIIILGMHRSGTSCLTGCLKNYGLQLGDVSEFNKYNQKGNQENRNVFRLNESVLNLSGGAWNSPDIATLKWNHQHEKQRDQILDDYNNMGLPWGIKDPRMLITLPFWLIHFPSHQFIGTIRHPKAVVKSLEARENLKIPTEVGYELWNKYNQQLLKYYLLYRFPIINFDLPNEKYLARVEQVATDLGFNTNHSSSFFSPDLKNQSSYSIDECPTAYYNLYKQLLDISNNC